MTTEGRMTERTILELTEDERLIVTHLRTLCLDRQEVLRRLATPTPLPVLPRGQELQANLEAVAASTLDPDGVSSRPMTLPTIDH